MALMYCRECGKQVSSEARSCPHCGAPWPTGPNEVSDAEHLERLNTLYRQPVPASFSPGVAAVLSFFIPGAGQIYRGKIAKGLVWLVCVLAGYAAFIFPGIILHIICIVNAASRD
jgi:uncharacterized OB-fold protein